MPTALALQNMLAVTPAGRGQAAAGRQRGSRKALAGLMVAGALGLGVLAPAGWNDCFAQELSRASQTATLQGEAVSVHAAANVPFLTPKREVPQSASPHPVNEAWDTATVICIALLAGLVLGALGAMGVREGRRYFQRDVRATQRLRERDHEAMQRIDDQQDANAH